MPENENKFLEAANKNNNELKIPNIFTNFRAHQQDKTRLRYQKKIV